MKARNSRPHITVIIPTRERADTLEKCLKTAIAQDYDDVTILVSDNFSQDSTRDVVRAAHDPRIRYLNTGRRLSMSANWEFALSSLEKEDTWVTILGDDDGLVPGALNRVAEVSRATEVLAIRSSVCAFAWPSLTNSASGRLGVPLGRGHEFRSSREWIKRVMLCRAPYFDLPVLYNGGFVSMAVLRDLRAKSGAFYRSSIPDVYSAFAIASLVDRYVFVREPLAINGLSKHSTGISMRAGAGGDASAHKFRAEDNIPLHSAIPLNEDGSLPAGQALVYECYLQSSFLRPGWSETSHDEQLALVLATAPTPAAVTWARRFAWMHGLDFEQARRKSVALRWALRVAALPDAAVRVTETYALGSEEFPIRDVYEASVAAGSIKRAPPSRLENMGRLAKRAVERMRQRVSAQAT